MISLILCAVMVLSFLPAQAFAADNMAEETTEAVPETEPFEESSAPTEAVTEPTGEITVPTEDVTVPAETVTEPTEESTVPTEEEETTPEFVSSDVAMATVASGTCGDNLTWMLDDGGTLTISGTGEMADFSSGNGGYKIPWGAYDDEITKIDIKDGVTSISAMAFTISNDYDLEVIIPNSVKNIGKWCFEGCGFTRISLPDTITTIPESTFSNCSNLAEIHIPASVTRIEDSAFQNCDSLKTVEIPENVKYMGACVFFDCAALESVKFCGDSPEIAPEYVGAIFDQNIIAYYPAGNVSWNSETLQDYNYETTTWIAYTKPGDTDEDAKWSLENGILTIWGTSGIDYRGWNKENVKSVIIQDGITSIRDLAFSGCGEMTNITIPDSVSSIGNRAFYKCGSLKNITISSSIGNGVFAGCSSLETVEILDNVTSIGDDVFAGCFELKSVELPEGVKRIGEGAFSDCYNLTSIVIPRTVSSIGNFAFGFSNLTSIYFEGNAPSFGADVFFQGQLTAYYPEGNETWEDIEEKTNYLVGDYGGNITWVPYTPTGEPEEDSSWLSELTVLDYLAFSSIAYKNFDDADKTGTIKDYLADKWSKPWSDDITYGELYENIAGWKPFYIKENKANGFYAVAFRNTHDEAVIAYRGSESLINILSDEDAFYDWFTNDFPMILGNIMGSQFEDAIETYNDVAKKIKKEKIVTTGHSLGGAWGDILSAYSGCKGVTFNAVPALDAAYREHVEKMAPNFSGVDSWNFWDHVNQFDLIAGVFETLSFNAIKPYVSYKGNWKFAHRLESLVGKDNQGNVVMNEEIGWYMPTSVISNYMTLAYESVDLGTYSDDRIDKHIAIVFPRITYGGNGNDTAITSIRSDRIIGGKGNDELDGRQGDDIYTYFKGDGMDSIKDAEGKDELRLYGFSESDVIQLYKGTGDAEYIYIRCNGENIVSIRTTGRTYKNTDKGSDKFEVKVMQGDKILKSFDITEYFSTRKYTRNLIISCPVNVEVLDADGSVVYTLVDGEVGNHYTDYGNFYIYEEEDGGYGKALDLVEGYSVRIVGTDDGTMDVTFRNVEDGELSEIENAVADIPVSTSFAATIEENADGTAILAADTDGDGTVDQEVAFEAVDTGPVENRVMIDAGIAEAHDSVWIDGKEYAVQTENGASFVDLPDGNAKTMIAYTDNEGDSEDIHTRYPVSMKVWTLSNADGIYTATHLEEFDDILQYSGASIRTTGKKGIRMITSMEQTKKNALTADGLAGYTLKEYGTVIAWADQLGDQPLVLGASYAKSNYAYKQGVADPVYHEEDGLMQYTNVLVNFSDAQCSKDIAMRSYMILEDADGNEVTLYGGIVTRSIGYIAYQNRNTCISGTESYEYIWDIIHTVYGDIYDDEYQA